MYSESERRNTLCDCVGAEQRQGIQRWSVIEAEIGKGRMAKLEKRERVGIKKVNEEEEGGEQGVETMLVFNGG